MGLKAIIFLSWILLNTVGYAAEETLLTGKVYSHSAPKGPPIFYYKKTQRSEKKSKTIRTSFRDPQGNEAVFEEFFYLNDELVRYTYNQLQTKEFGIIEISDGQLKYQYDSHGKIKRNKEKITGNLVFLDQITKTIQNHWDELVAGNSYLISYPLVERLDTINFKFSKNTEQDCNGQPCTQFYMRPSSIIIAALMGEPIRLYFRNKDKVFLKSDGRLPIREAKVANPKSPDDWRAINAILEIDQAPAASSTEAAPIIAPAPARMP